MRPELAPLRFAYSDLGVVALSLSERDSWCGTGCPGWSVRDLFVHLLGDAQRALVALATPADRPADRTASSYWIDSPGQEDPESRGLRSVRTMAAAWRLEYLAATYAETTRAVLTLAERSDSESVVATQGHALQVGDLIDTLTVEAGLHHLDLLTELDRPGPNARVLATIRRTLDGLLGHPAPSTWDDLTWARIGSGRSELSAADRAALGPDADRFPLIK
ncbi:mycothiol maleylpyruvate isomerase-like protein [Jatrophihabitans sp. GAS493]|uniref:maleylpyruvate isomerase N-terminal domain-containing protein n=1 Tax=Jatrophihabitans sp. GAS493 TaxID=1907575 RepID=UPI000BC01439|nr:maleylpyruvate isomerase N-terminal domain-containing protein [Jatrophihabitans sp. GAS493]SOD74807.1 mycothiol maleylpyruvate isomerase-like protein [Jatrophihabitans sp. GAS493]